MVCEKCGYKENKQKLIFNRKICNICSKFAPKNQRDFEKYISEKIDWKILDTFRNNTISHQKRGMINQAKKGIPMSRAPKGYEFNQGELIPNSDAVIIHSLFRTFLNRKYSLNSLAKNFSLSINGLKKILTNRTYLGEIKFNGQYYKGIHQPIISPEIFYAVQRKLQTYLRPRKILKLSK
jgi:hypothetical protein